MEAFTQPVPDDLMKNAVDRFLAWKLPADFNPDCGVFAPNAKEARKQAAVCIADWFDSPWIDVAVLLQRNKPWLFDEADPNLYAGSVPHVVSNPKVCPRCELWGWKRVGDGCEGCAEL